MPQSALHLRGATDVDPATMHGVDRALTMIDELGAAPDTSTPFSMTLCLCLATPSANTHSGVGLDHRADPPA
jgi:hypothetical protein